MKTNVLQDTFNLALNIQKSLKPGGGQPIMNIAKDKRKNFKLQGYPQIQQILGYEHDKTPELLVDKGIIEAVTWNWWYVGVQKSNSKSRNILPDEISVDDNISELARNKRYILDDEAIEYYFKDLNDVNSSRIPVRHAAVVINEKRLELFIQEYTTLTPAFNNKNGCFEYLGQQIRFRRLEKKCIKLLIKYLNNIVSYKDFYEVRGRDYNIKVADRGKSKVDEASRSMFKRIRTKLMNNEKLRQSLTLRESDGFQMLIKD